VDYYRKTASLWEIQAALKMRPVGGNLDIGYDFLNRIRPVFLEHRNRDEIVCAIEKMRKAAMGTRLRSTAPKTDVKTGMGGLRDVEFLVQGLQLVHGPDDPHLLEANTLKALKKLGQAGLLPEPVVTQLKKDYLFLRRIEHCLQILEDRQIHTLPKTQDELAALAKRVMGMDGNANQFMEQLEGCLKRVRNAYDSHLLEGK
jgi:glutamate-ammonia-ligase adenylyltransferase